MITLGYMEGKSVCICEDAEAKVAALKTKIIKEKYQDRFDALKEANLTLQLGRLYAEMQVTLAKEVGFEQYSIEELSRLLMNEPDLPFASRQGAWGAWEAYEWFYCPDFIPVEFARNGNKMQTNYRTNIQNVYFEKKGGWFSRKSIVKECRLGPINSLKIDIPYGVILRINELKKLDIFNCFNVIAPISVWKEPVYRDPIIVASIVEMENKREQFSVNDMTHFFVAKW